MSHYCVAVITSNESCGVDELLSKYDENIEVDKYIRRTKAQIIEDKRKHCAEVRQDIDAYANGTYDTNNYRLYWLDDENNPNSIRDHIKLLLKTEHMTDEDVYKNSIYEDTDYDEDGNELSTYNPDSKWDWYVVGGRWSDSLKKKDGTFCDECKVSEVDFNRSEEDIKKFRRWWEVVIEEKPLIDNESKDDFHLGIFDTKESILEKYKTIDNYIKASQFHTWAVVTPDGEWHEPGKMGWFATTSASAEDELNWQLNYYDNFIKPYLDGDYTITIVDCHI